MRTTFLGEMHECDLESTTCESQGEGLGSHCVCKPGTDYVDDDKLACSDVDECDADTHNCDAQATCTNGNALTGDHFTCTCNSGYEGDGTLCVDTNECNEANDCHTEATCTNFDGDYSCACNSGFEDSVVPDKRSGHLCTDVDECIRLTDNCREHSTCHNNVGGFTCPCDLGYTDGGDTSAPCSPTVDCDLGTCTDTNAYCREIDGVDYMGINFDGLKTGLALGYSCDCNTGFEWSEGVCIDIDECESDATYTCQENAFCTNTVGS